MKASPPRCSKMSSEKNFKKRGDMLSPFAACVKRKLRSTLREKNLASVRLGQYAIGMKIIHVDDNAVELEMQNGTCLWAKRDATKILIARKRAKRYRSIEWRRLSLPEQKAIEKYL